MAEPETPLEEDAVWYVELAAPDDVLSDAALLDPDLAIEAVDISWLARPEDSRNSLAVRAPSDTAAVEVRNRAKRLLGPVNEKLAADSPLHPPIDVGAYIWQPDPAIAGGFRRHVVVEWQGLEIRISPPGATALVNGCRTEPPRTLGRRQKELEARSPDFATAMSLFAEADEDVRKLWVPFEYVRDRSGFDPETLAPRSEVRAFCETANNRPNVRHIGGQRAPKHKALSGAEARRLVAQLLRAWVDRSVPF